MRKLKTPTFSTNPGKRAKIPNKNQNAERKNKTISAILGTRHNGIVSPQNKRRSSIRPQSKVAPAGAIRLLVMAMLSACVCVGVCLALEPINSCDENELFVFNELITNAYSQRTDLHTYILKFVVFLRKTY